MKLGLVGLGRMGRAICERLRAHDITVMAWDHDAGARSAVSNADATVVGSASAVATAADTIISTITDDAGARSLFLGDRGFLTVAVAGKLFVEMSTLQPATVREIAAAVAAKSARLIDCPVLGSIPTVREGKLLVLAGGQTDDIARAHIILDHLARRVIHMGPVGCGSAAKLAVNIGLAAYLQSLSESLALAQRQGVAVEQMLEVLAEAPTANAILASKMPALRGGVVNMTLDIATLRKDVMSAVATGALSGVAMPVSTGALTALSAAVAGGWDRRDIGELPQFFRDAMLQKFVP